MDEKKMEQGKPKLKRALGLFETTIAGIGIIIGVGIYALIGKAAGIVGNEIWISFVIGAIVAALTALSYAELSSIFPKAGAEYVYVEKSFGRRLAFLAGWLIIIGAMISAAVVSLGFAGYFVKLVAVPPALVALILIVVLSFINFYGIKESAFVAIAGAVIEVVGLLIIVVIGLPYLGHVNYLELPPDASNANLFSAAALIFFAFLGFESITRLSEETKDAEKTIPKATLLSLAISTIIYILIAVVAVSVVPWQKLAESPAPLSDVANAALGPNASLLLTLIALFATANTVLLLLVTDTRILYGMAEGGIFPKRFRLAEIHKERQTPWIAAAVIGVISVVCIFLGDITVLANATNFTVFVTFIIINFAVIWFRYTQPNLKRPFKSPSIGSFPITAVLGVATSALLATSVGHEVIMGGTVLIIVGIVVYEVFVKKF